MSKNIKNNYVKESLLDYENIANSIKENSKDIVKDLLKEAVRETYNSILTEEEEDEYDVEEVDDTNSDNDSKETEEEEISDDTEDSEEESELDNDVEDEADDDDDDDDEFGFDEEDDSVEDSETDEKAWETFDKYKVSDNEYDFSEAKDEEFVKVFKLLKNDDQVVVNSNTDNGKLEIKDNETGAEYLIDMNGSDDSVKVENELEDMNESVIFELMIEDKGRNTLMEKSEFKYDYQHGDVMTNDGMSEPGKNVNSWDAGVPKGTSKPWVGNKGDMRPFSKKVSESDEDMDDETIVEIASDTHNATRRTTMNYGRNSQTVPAGRNSSRAGVKMKGTSTPRYSQRNESVMSTVDRILKENKELKNSLVEFKKVLTEAAVTNVNLGKIIKLISENATTREEKQEIIARFGESKTIKESNRLFETISNELKKRDTMNINEGKQYSVNGSQKINETQIYKSDDLVKTLELMHKICK